MVYETKYKEGLKVSNVKWIEFGKLLLNLYMLNNNHTLSVKYYSNGGVSNLRKTENLSDDFVLIINTLIDEKIFNYDLSKNLDDNEKELLIRLLTISGLGSYFKINYSQLKETIDEVKNQFKNIQQEIMSGNKDILTIKKAISLTNKLVKYGAINKTEGDEIINELEGIL